MYKRWEIKKEDNNGRYFIVVIFNDSQGEFYIDDVYHVLPKKKTRNSLKTSAENQYDYRRKNTKDRAETVKQRILEVVPEQFLLEALDEAWKQVKPIELVVGFRRE